MKERKLNERAKVVLMRKRKKNCFLSSQQSRCEYNCFSVKNTVCEKKTIRRLLKQHKTVGRAAAKKIFLKAKIRLDRLRWVNENKYMHTEKWSRHGFTDECRFNLRRDGRVLVWRLAGERRNQQYTVSRSSDRRSVQFWGAISYNDVLPLRKLQIAVTPRGYLSML